MRMPAQGHCNDNSGNMSSSSGVFSYDEAEMYTGYSGSSGSSHHGGGGGGGRMKSGYQSLVDVVYNGRGQTGGPAWLQNTLPQNNNNSRPLGRSTSVKPGHLRAGFFNRAGQDGNARPRRRDLSEPTPPPPPVPPVVRPSGGRGGEREPPPPQSGSARKRQPLPNIFYYGSQDNPPSPNNIDERYSQPIFFISDLSNVVGNGSKYKQKMASAKNAVLFVKRYQCEEF